MQHAFQPMPCYISSARITGNVGTTCHAYTVHIAGLLTVADGTVTMEAADGKDSSYSSSTCTHTKTWL